MPEPSIRNEDRPAEVAGGRRDRHPEIAALASVLPVGILRSDLEGRFFYISERATDVTGLTAESALESGWEQCVHPDDREAVLRQVSLALHTRKPWQAEFRCVVPGGRIRWLLSQATPEHDLQGHVVGFVWTVSDTTHTHEALRASEERFKLATKNAGVGVLDYDVMANRGLWSPELCSHLGIPEGRLATLAEGFEFCHPDDRARVEGAMTAALDPRGSGVFAEEFRIRRADTGDVRWIACTCQTTFEGAADGRRPVRFTGITIDITERRARETHVQVEEALQARRDAERDQERTVELEYRTAQLSRLASDLTLAEQHAREELAKTLHDGLQQLLVGAALNLERHLTREEQRGAGPDELLVRAKGHLDQASVAARSLSLELFPPALHLLGLPAALTWLAGRTRNQYGLVVQVSADPLANSDRKDVRTLLFESVRELLFNAVKHAHVDRVTIDLSLDQDDALSITVADQGIGFDPAGLVERGKTGKAGWGLFSIRERLTLLGGRFDIESAPGQGTRFRLVAPRGEAQGGIDGDHLLSRVATRPALQDAVGSASVRALRILVVDDHAAVRRVFRELLQERPELHVVGEAADGLEAIAEAHAHRPDVILMDVSMPGMDGIEATRRIRAELPFIQILGLSTQMKTDDLHAIELAGAVGFFTKGVDTQRLIDHLMAVHVATTLELPSQTA